MVKMSRINVATLGRSVSEASQSKASGSPASAVANQSRIREMLSKNRRERIALTTEAKTEFCTYVSFITMNNNTQSTRQTQKHSSIKLVINLMAACLGLLAAETALAMETDPFAKDTWHAIEKTWPGTIKFDQKTHKVVLEPVGAPAINATYTFTVKRPLGGPSKLTMGTLTMTNTQGQISESEFKLENNKYLTLTYKGGPLPERYVRMSKAEEDAERARLEKAIKSGAIKPIPTATSTTH